MHTKFDDVYSLRQKTTGGWPCWPYCPVKKYAQKGQMPICGLVMDTRPLTASGSQEEVEPIVYVGLNLFKSWTKEEFEKCEKLKFDSMDHLVADGWMVD